VSLDKIIPVLETKNLALIQKSIHIHKSTRKKKWRKFCTKGQNENKNEEFLFN